MHDSFTLFLHLILTIIRLSQPGGLRAVVAESGLMRHQILIQNRGRKRAPNLRSSDRIIAGLCTLFMRPARHHTKRIEPENRIDELGILVSTQYSIGQSSCRRCGQFVANF